jgi:tetratricopeptide (TPR) repeat protein
MSTTTKQCKALKFNKERCARSANQDSQYCWQHEISRLADARWYNNSKIQAYIGLAGLALSLVFGIGSCVTGVTKADQQANNTETQRKLDALLAANHTIPDEIKQAIETVFLNVLREKAIPQSKWSETLGEIARRHLELQGKWQSFQSSDPTIIAIRNQSQKQIGLGNYDEADQLMQEAVAIDRKAIQNQQTMLDQRKLSIAQSQAGRAAIFAAKLNYKQSNVLYRDALASLPTNEMHFRAFLLLELGNLFSDIGDIKNAESLYKNALAIQEQVFPQQQYNIGIIVNNLANLYEAQGMFEQAEPLYKRSEAMLEQSLGANHPILATSLSDQACMYSDRGLFVQAEQLARQALAIRERTLGRDHPDVAISLHDLAEVYCRQGQFDKAEPLLQRTLTILDKANGSSSPLAAEVLNNLAQLYCAKGLYGKIKPLYQKSLAIMKGFTNPYHPAVVASLRQLADQYAAQHQSAEAEQIYKCLLATMEEGLGADHPYVATALDDLARLYYFQHNFAKAEPLYQRSLSIEENSFGPNSLTVATTLKNMALLYRETDRKKDAEALEKRAQSIQTMQKIIGN